jgi:uncharacterized membrane protein
MNVRTAIEIKENISFIMRPASVFILLASIACAFLVLVTPPFQAPDEGTHFYRAYHISLGHLKALDFDGLVGGLLPEGIRELFATYFMKLAFHPDRKVTPAEIINGFSIKLMAHKKIIVAFPNTALYPPVPYFVQAGAILVTRSAELPLLAMAYSARIANATLYVIITALAIRIIPVSKWMLFVIAMSPMALFQAASISADVTTYCMGFLFIAYILRTALVPEINIGWRCLIAVFALSFMILSCKNSYFPMILLYFIIPRSKFGSQTRYFIISAVYFTFCFICAFYWSFSVRNLLVPTPGADPGRQFGWLLSHPSEYLSIVFFTFKAKLKFYLASFIGELGWLDTNLPLSFIMFYSFAIAAAGILNFDSEIIISKSKRFIIGGIFALNLFTILTMLFIWWTPPGSLLIEGVQGRYFIPFSPLAFVLLYGKKFDKCSRFARAFPYIMTLCALISVAVTYYSLIYRYYVV